MKRQRGLSLLEMLLSLAVAAIVFVPLRGLLRTNAAASSVAADRVTIEREADFALERIAVRVRATAPALLSPNADSSTSGSWFGACVFQLSAGKLTETNGTAVRVLAENVTAFSITAPTVQSGQQRVEASLTLARGDASTTHYAAARMGGAR